MYFQWQQSAGICQFQIKVCGFRQPGVAQDNWLFTQHISKSFDANTNNYDVEILVNITYALKSCRSDRNPSCNTRFKLYRYITNSQQLPSTSNNGFMNTENYQLVDTVNPIETGPTYTVVVVFEMQTSQTGVYLAIRDEGTCLGISRLLVHRYYCREKQIGLVRYPDTPAPITGSVSVDVLCADNAENSSSAAVTCDSEGQWGPEMPTCGCSPGYEINMDPGDSCNSE